MCLAVLEGYEFITVMAGNMAAGKTLEQLESIFILIHV